MQKLGLSQDQLTFYNVESTDMLANWLNDFVTKLVLEMKESKLDLITAFNKLKPVMREEEYKDQELMVRGYVDAIHEEKGETLILDYKTSKTKEITDEYRLQLGIYAALYQKKHNKLPEKVGIWFLKTQPKFITVDESLIKDSLFEIEQVHFGTESDMIKDYPKNRSGLCKYSTGQCDFYDVCVKDR